MLSAGGDENQMIARKASRSKGAINPERALERAAKVGFFSFTDTMTVFLTQCRKRSGLKKRLLKQRKRGKTRSPKKRLGQ
jgi:hypothetical protein